MNPHRIIARLASLSLVTSFAACDQAAPVSPDDLDAPILFGQAESPPLPPASDFVAVVDNPFFPLIPGTIFEYRAETDEGVETIVTEVTRRTKRILGIRATVVHDQVFLDGELIEDTFDWYAQDSAGNVWYLGEDSCEIEDGECVSTAGSWEAGVDGAQAGIIMWSDPSAHIGETYRQEFFAGEAEDVAKVLGLGVDVSVPYDDFSGCLETLDWSALDPGTKEHKFYCAGTGLVLETAQQQGGTQVELVALTGK